MRLRRFLSLGLTFIACVASAHASRPADLPTSEGGILNDCGSPRGATGLYISKGGNPYSPVVQLTPLTVKDANGNSYTVHVDAYDWGTFICTQGPYGPINPLLGEVRNTGTHTIFFAYVVGADGTTFSSVVLNSLEISLPLTNPAYLVCDAGWNLCNTPAFGYANYPNNNISLQPAPSSGADGTGTVWSFGTTYDTTSGRSITPNSGTITNRISPLQPFAVTINGSLFTYTVGTGTAVLVADGTVQCDNPVVGICNNVSASTPYSLTFVPPGSTTTITASSQAFVTATQKVSAAGHDVITNPIALSGTSFSAVYDTSSNTPLEMNGAPTTAKTYSCGTSTLQQYRSVYFQYTAAATGSVNLSTSGSHYDTVLSIPSLQLCNDDSDPNSKGAVTSSLTFQATKGTTYQILVTEYPPSSATVSSHTYVAPLTGDPTLYFTLTTPQLNATPTSLSNFGSVTIGKSSSSQTVSLASNTTNFGATGITGITASATGDFQVTPAACATPLADSGPPCSLSVVFTPTAAGTRTGTLTIASSGATVAANTPIAVALTGTGLTPVPVVALSPATTLTFSGQAVGTHSIVSNVLVSNTGTASLTVSTISITGDFSQTNTCTSGSVAAPGQCTILVTFSPTAAGTRTGLLTITDNAGTGSQQINLSGTGIGTPTISWTTPAAITYGTALASSQLNATASVPGTFVYSPAAGTGLSSGSKTLSVAFTPTDTVDYVGANSSVALTVNPAPLTVTGVAATRKIGLANPSLTATLAGVVNSDSLTASATTTATTTSPVGSYPIVPSVTGSAISNYSVTPVNGALTITQAASASTIAASATSIFTGASITFTATVTSATSGTPTGTVQFLNGTSVLSTQTLSGGVATFTTTALAAGSYSVTASYGGDTNFTSSASSSVAATVLAPDYSITSNPTSLTIKQGQSGTATFTVTPTGGFNQTITFSCTGLPSGATCNFAPASVAPNGVAVTSQLTITTTAPTAMLNQPFPWKPLDGSILAALLFGIFGRRTRLGSRARLYLFLLASVGLLVPAIGCSSGGSKTSSTSNPGTPVGSTQLTITAAAGGSNSHAANLTVTITN